MGDLPDEMREAHAQGRSETREVLASGEMSDAYAYKLTKGSFGLAFWLMLALGIWLKLGAHWAVWQATVTVLVGWPFAAIALAALQTAAIMLIWRARGVHRPNSN